MCTAHPFQHPNGLGGHVGGTLLTPAMSIEAKLEADLARVETELFPPQGWRAKKWTPDTESPDCSLCGKMFKFVYRMRHHCRGCGRLVCDACTQNRGFVSGRHDQRVCNECAPSWHTRSK